MKILSTSEKVNLEKNFVGLFFPCFEDCQEVDLTFDDNGNIEHYTKERKLSHDTFNMISLCNGNIKLMETGEIIDTF